MDNQRNTQTLQQHKGYIFHMSTKKRTSAGGTHFDIQLQDSPTSSKKVKLFGDHNYKRAKQLQDEHSPVKIRLNFNEKFKHYQLNW